MNMNNTFRELFGRIEAQEELKERTKAFLAERTGGYTRGRAKRRKYYISAAAWAVFLLMLSVGHWLYFTPIAEISIDINPSFEIKINRFDQVIFVEGFNEQGREFSRAPGIKYRNYTDAIGQILDNDTIKTLLSDNEIMTITVTGPDGQRCARILSGVEACTADRSNTYCYFTTWEEAAAAHEMGLSCGKYRAFLELQLLDPDITPETVQGMTMREIRELTESLSDQGGNAAPPYGSCGKGRRGNGCGYGKRWASAAAKRDLAGCSAY